MEYRGARRRADEPHGFLPRAWAAGPPAWRRLADWLLGDGEDIDQQGLLAERTLFPRPAQQRARPDAAPPPASRGDDER